MKAMFCLFFLSELIGLIIGIMKFLWSFSNENEISATQSLVKRENVSESDVTATFDAEKVNETFGADSNQIGKYL